jgi:hypothetical protein
MTDEFLSSIVDRRHLKLKWYPNTGDPSAQSASMELPISGVAKRRQHVAVGVSPRKVGQNQLRAPKGRPHISKDACFRRFAAHEILGDLDLRAYARSYMLPPLRGSGDASRKTSVNAILSLLRLSEKLGSRAS